MNRPLNFEMLAGRIISVEALVAYVSRAQAKILDDPNYSVEQMQKDQARHEAGLHDSGACKFCAMDAAALEYVMSQPKLV